MHDFYAILEIRGRFLVLRAATWLLLAFACVLAGSAALAWRHQLLGTSSALSGHGLPALFANGSTPITALSCWLAAAGFTFGAWNLRRRLPEPPIFGAAAPTVQAMRRGLRQEYLAIRTVLWILLAVCVFDLARVAHDSFNGGDILATAPLLWSWLEAGGLIAASAALAWWSIQFRRQLLQLAAIN